MDTCVCTPLYKRVCIFIRTYMPSGKSAPHTNGGNAEQRATMRTNVKHSTARQLTPHQNTYTAVHAIAHSHSTPPSKTSYAIRKINIRETQHVA